MSPAPMPADKETGRRQAAAVSVERFADCGPGEWWFVHHPDGFLIEVGVKRDRALRLAAEINAGRGALIKDKANAR